MSQTQVDMNPHKYERRGRVAVLTEENHYIRIADPDSGAKYYLQKGRVFMGTDTLLKKDEVPQWIYDRMEKMEPKVLAQAGFGDKSQERKLRSLPDDKRYEELLKQGVIDEEEYQFLLGKTETNEEEKAPMTVEDIQAELDAQKGNDLEEPEKPSIDVSMMSRTEMMTECKNRGIPVQNTDKKEDLRAKLEVA